MRLPLPAEIMATIEPEMTERRLLVSKLFRAKLADVEYEGEMRSVEKPKLRRIETHEGDR
jgi:hypothetical protein